MFKQLSVLVSPEAAKDFNVLVCAIKLLTAVKFIETIHRFKKNRCRFDPSVLFGPEDPIVLDDEYVENHTGANLGAIMPGFQLKGRCDETGIIIKNFNSELEKLSRISKDNNLR